MCNVSFHPQAFLTQIRADKIFLNKFPFSLKFFLSQAIFVVYLLL